MSTASRNFKNTAYGQLARIGKALAHPLRVEILDLLAQRPFRVEELANELDQPIANASHHLQILSRERLVERQREGVHIRYALADPLVTPMLVSLRRLAEDRLLELEEAVRELLQQRDASEPIGLPELFDRLQSGELTLIDVRPADEYQQGHLPGAVSLPIGELSSRMGELPKDRTVVAYCRGPFCVLALEAVERLRAVGFEAEQFSEGVPGWLAAGNEIERE